MLSRFLANMATKAGKAPLFDSPEEYGLKYEDVVFKATDGVELKGWLINPDQKKVIVQNHFGIFCSRAGYTNEGKGLMKGYDRDIHFLKHMKALANEGYTVLAYDLRNHGTSSVGTNQWICDGQEEYKDILAAVNYILSRDEYKKAPIGILSMCMGSSSMTLAHGIKGGLQEVDNIKAHVVIQPLYSGAWFRTWRMPEFVIRKAVRISEKRGGVNFDKSPLANVKSIHAPTMVIQNRNDPIFNAEYVNAYYDELRVKKEMVWSDLKKNRLAAYADVGEHPEEMLRWFNRHV